MNTHLYIPQVQVRENSLLIWDKPEYPPRHQRNIKGFKTAYSGQVKKGTEKRIRKAIDIFLQLNPTRTIWNPVVQCHHPFRLGFMTLTISEDKRMIDAKEGYQLLKPFIEWTKTKGVKNYIWKAELQKRDQLHYHLTIDEFVHWEDIRHKWNQLQRKAGLLDSFARKFKHFNPNSTDIHAVKNIQNIELYLAKYIAKSEQNEKALNGKIWDCSDGLNRKRFSDELDSQTESNIRKAVEGGKLEQIRLAHCTLIAGKTAKTVLSKPIQNLYAQWKV